MLITFAKNTITVIKNWYLFKSRDAFQVKESWCVCGNIYEKKDHAKKPVYTHITYRQIPINKIKDIKKISENVYELNVRKFESLDDTQSLNSVSGKDRDEHIKKMKKVQNIDTIVIDINDLDKYFKKRKDLKEKHTTGLMKLVNRFEK